MTVCPDCGRPKASPEDVKALRRKIRHRPQMGPLCYTDPARPTWEWANYDCANYDRKAAVELTALRSRGTSRPDGVSVGTKSLLVGAHWPLHNVAVAVCWRWMYGRWPTWREAVAIALHDVGYLGCVEMDGQDGSRHPELGAVLADRILGQEYGNLIRGHSKGYADLVGVPLSRLYGPDKMSHVFEPAWLYCWRTRLTGELEQYRSCQHGCNPRVDRDGLPDRDWFRIVRARMARGGLDYVIKLLAPDGTGEHNGR